MLEILGLQLQVQGNAHVPGPLLIVSNHISWADITVIHATRFCRFVSKAGVRHWPIVGHLAASVGTLFIERESRRDAMRVVHQMAQCLTDGEVLAVFPEGTTSDGRQLLPFHGNLLQAAIATQVPVQPVAIDFWNSKTGTFSERASYVGNDWLLSSLWRTLSSSDQAVRVTFGQPELAMGRDRRTWAHDLNRGVAQLRQPAPHRGE
jgi:1-acyl-sn-glycerol-3-phosphate acyltransferase